MEKFRDFLWQSNVEHKSEQFRNDRKVITHEVFRLKSDFRVQAKIEGDHETGRMKIVSKNVGGFQVDLFQLLALEMNDQAVEEFAKYFIGRPNKWDDVVKRSTINSRPAAQVQQKPKAAPQYMTQPQAAPETEEEKKNGLLGSLKSVLNKPIF
jgi:hypothetical protein